MSARHKSTPGRTGMAALIAVICFGMILACSSQQKGRVPQPVATEPALVSPEQIETTPEPTEGEPAIATSSPTPVVIVVTATPGPTEPPPPTATPVVVVVTATPAPTLTPVPQVATSRPVDDLNDLVSYAETIKPILDEGLAAAERDGAILKASEQDSSALCGGERSAHSVLVADAALMHDLVNRLNGMSPPSEAALSVHQPLVDSARLWGEALDNINRSCQTGNQVERGLLRLGAMLQLSGSMLNFRIATDNFWRLLIVNGLETLASH